MSELIADRPSRPDSWLTMWLNCLAVTCSWRERYQESPGSRSPERLPMGRPAAGVKPMVVSMLLPWRTAVMLAPLPRWARMTRPPAASGPAARSSASSR